MPNWRRQAIEGIPPGTEFSFSRTFTGEDTAVFGDITRDYNPVHYEMRFAAAKGFPRLICHGLLVGSMICELGGQLAWLASGMSFKFIKPVYFGDTVTCTVTITGTGEKKPSRAEAVFTNQDGQTVMTGTLAGYLPDTRSAQVLERMVEEGDPTNAIGARGVNTGGKR